MQKKKKQPKKRQLLNNCKYPFLNPWRFFFTSWWFLYMMKKSKYIILLFWRYLNHAFPQQYVLFMSRKARHLFLLLYHCAVDLTWFLFISISVVMFTRRALERKGACLPLPDWYSGVIGIILYQPGPGEVWQRKSKWMRVLRYKHSGYSCTLHHCKSNWI